VAYGSLGDYREQASFVRPPVVCYSVKNVRDNNVINVVPCSWYLKDLPTLLEKENNLIQSILLLYTNN